MGCERVQRPLLICNELLYQYEKLHLLYLQDRLAPGGLLYREIVHLGVRPRAHGSHNEPK